MKSSHSNLEGIGNVNELKHTLICYSNNCYDIN